VNEDDPLVVSDEITDSVDRSVIAVPLQEEMRKQPVRHLFAPGTAVSAERIDVVIDLNYNFTLGVEGARKKVECILAYLEFLTTQADSAEERRHAQTFGAVRVRQTHAQRDQGARGHR